MTASVEIHRIASGRTEAPESLRDAVRSAAGDAPTSRDLAVLAAALGPVFAAPPSSFPAPPPNGLSQSMSLGARVLGAGAGKATVVALVALCAAGGGYGTVRWLRSSSSASHDIAPAPRVETQPAVPPNAIPAPELPAEPARPEGAAAAPAVRSREPSKSRAVEPAPPSRDEAAPQAEPPKQEVSEWALVEQARRSLASDPRRALALAEEHKRKFEGGPLSEEADFIEIEAQKRLGHADEARALSDRFRKRYPSSIHGQSVTVPPTPKP
jgi:hypothetical protein